MPGNPTQSTDLHLRLSRLTAMVCLGLAALLAASCGSTRQATDPEARLITEFRKWEGAPYRLGGDSRRGVDCSAFVQIIMKDAYGITIPRTTREQMDFGRRLPAGTGRLGDLVFFQTGRTTYHVGILMRGDFFMHASTSRGVTIDRLGEPYWRERMIQVRRVTGR